MTPIELILIFGCGFGLVFYVVLALACVFMFRSTREDGS